MGAWKCGLSALFAGVLTTALARGEGTAELTFVLGSGNWLGATSPAPTPWETLEGFRSGRDTRARIAVGREQAGAFRGVQTSALLRLDVSLASAGQEGELRVRDASSWLGVTWKLRPALAFELRTYPLDTDYVRLGYAHALDWGGTDVARRESVFLNQQGGVPGVELGLVSARVRLFTWLKAAQLEAGPLGPERAWGGAAGGTFEVSKQWSVNLGFGFFQRPPTFLEGATVRLVWHRGVPEPELAAEPFRPAPFRSAVERFEADTRTGAAIAVEGVTLVTRQRRYEDPAFASTTLAPAVALYGSLRTSRWAGHFLLSCRSLPFLLKNDPRVSPEQALPVTATLRPELGAWLGGSWALPTLRLVPSVELGARLPAALSWRSSDGTPGQIFVASGPAGLEALAPGTRVSPFLAARASVRFQASTGLALVISSEYQEAPNHSALVEAGADALGSSSPSRSLTLLVAARARF